MKNGKTLLKTFLVAIFAFAMMFTGISFVMPQDKKTVYAESSFSEKWIMNNTINYTGVVSFDIDFTSNGDNYQFMDFNYNHFEETLCITYNTTTVYNSSWTNSAFQTITFTEQPTGNLLTLLQSNATQQTFTLTYNTDGGTMPNDWNTEYSGQTTLPNALPTPTKSGYTFSGWFTDKSLNTSVIAGATLTQSTTLYAKWDLITYNITYNLNGGTNSGSNPTTYTTETATITLVNPTKTGYKFLGWFSEILFDTQVTTIMQGSTGDKTLYAKWGHEHGVEGEKDYMLFDKDFSLIFFNQVGDQLADGNYYLSEDCINVMLSQKRICIPQNTTVNLCLNGYVLSLKKLCILNEGTFTIYDCGTTVRYFTDEESVNYVNCEYSGITVGKDGCYESYYLEEKENSIKTVGGVITGGWGQPTYTYGQNPLNISNGGACYNTGTLTINGGNIVGNLASCGGAILNRNIFNFNGGKIAGNRTAGLYYQSEGYYYGAVGGGICNVGGTYINGGEIIYNNAGTGGGIYNENNSLINFNKGNISYNKAEYGGGIANYSVLNMTGGSLTHNEGVWGGAINAYGTTNLLGGSITDNTITYNGNYAEDFCGAGIDYYNTNKVLLGGKIVIKDNKTNGELDNIGFENQYKEAVTLILSTETPLETGAYIGIRVADTSQEFISGLQSKTDISYFHSDDANCYVKATEIAGTPKTYNFYINEKHTFTYNKNTTDTVTNMPEEDKNVYAEGDMVTVSTTTPTRVAYDFLGWNTDEKATSALTFVDGKYTIANSDVTLYAIWTATTYNITYNLDNGTNDSNNPATYTIETATITLANPTRIGYNFGGWFSDNSCAVGNEVTSISLGSTGDKTLYAKWTPITYNITYNLNSGTNDSKNPATYNIETATITLANPTRTGYKFLGWFSDSDCTAGNEVTSISLGSTGDKTFYAKWQEKTTVAINTSIQRMIYDGNAKTPVLKDTNSVEITLSGFNYSYQMYQKIAYADCSDTKNPGLYKVHITRVEDDEYKAIDSYIEFVVTYTLTYKANTGIGDDIIDNADDDSIHKDYFGPYCDSAPNTYEFDKQAHIKASTFTKDNYTFAFWNTKQDGTGTPYYKDELLTLTDNLVLYACYSANISKQPTKDNDYTVSVATTDSVSYQWKKEVIEITDATIDSSKVLTGTYNSQDNTVTSYNNSILISCSVLKALQFTSDVTIPTTDSITYENGVYYCSPTVGKGIWYFIGNTTQFTISNLKYFSSTLEDISGETEDTIKNVAENVRYCCEITSQFNATILSDYLTPKAISFDGGDDATGTAPNTMYQLEGRKITLPTNTFTRNGYKFLGWNTDKDAKTALTFENGKFTMGTNNVTLYAIWQEKLTISLDQTTQYFNVETNTSDIAFAIMGTNIPTSGFNISYRACSYNSGNYEANLFTTNKVSQSYDVKITRAEDDTYKALDVTITKGIKLYVSVTYYNSDATSGTVPVDDNKYVYYDMNLKRTEVLANSGNLIRTGYTLDGWYYCYTNETNVSKVSKVNLDTISKYININDSYNIHVYPNWQLNVNDITKNNDYTVSSSANLSNCTYSWCVNSIYKLSDLTNGSTTAFASGIDYEADMDTLASLTSEYDLCINLKYYEEGCYVRFKTTNGYISYVGMDGEYYTLNPIINGEYFYVKFENLDGEPDCIFDIQIVQNKNISGETNAKLGNAAKGQTVYCVVSYQQTVHNIIIKKTVKTNAVAVKEVKFDANGATAGTAPATQYQLEGRSVTLPTTVSLTKTGHQFLGFNTSAGDTEKLVSYTMGSSDTTLYAIWQEKTTVSITETAQEKTYNANGQGFDLIGTHKDIGSFTIEYYVGSAWTTTAPTNTGSYNVKITRAEDDNYKSYEKEISNGLVINKANVVITIDQTAIVKTYGETITIPQATTNFGEVSCDKVASDLVNAGIYTITYTVAGTDNYNGDTKTVSVTINKLAVNEPTVVGTYKYTGKAQTVKLNGKENYMTTTDSLIQTNIGIYTITFTLDNNHEWATGSNGIITWEIRAIQLVPEEQQEKSTVIVENKDGFTGDITVIVEITIETEIEQKELAVDYYNLDNEAKLSTNEKVGIIFNVKLIKTVADVSYEIQPSEIADGTKIKVKMLIPETVDILKVTRILHVHSAGDIEEIEFDASKVDENGYYEIEIDRLSEFAFIYQAEFQSSFLIIFVLGGFGLLLIEVLLLLFLTKKKIVVISNEKVVKVFEFRPLQKIEFNDEFKNHKLYTNKELTNAFTSKKMGFKSIVVYDKDFYSKW